MCIRDRIVTLAQADDAGKARAAQFIEDLADLVENRPPKALEAKLESDDSIPERFDFGRADYRILIALREDYLAHLEGLQAAMPSITQNRLPPPRMTAQQPPPTVLDPRGDLVLARPTLARRPDSAALAAGTVLFYDNTKLDVGHFGLLLPTLKAGLAARGIARFVDERLTIRGTSGQDIDALARRFQALGVSAAVIALADMGVSPAMVALTVAMERLGIPTVLSLIHISEPTRPY